MAMASKMAMTGMWGTDECKNSFMEMKWKKVHRYIVFKIDEKSKLVMVDKVGSASEGYSDLEASLPGDECRYAVFDFDFVTVDNCHKSKIFFIAWYLHLQHKIRETTMEKYKNLRKKFNDMCKDPNHQMKMEGYIDRAPNASRIRAKMLYATSKDGIRRVLEGIHYELQATDPTEMGFDIIQDRAK